MERDKNLYQLLNNVGKYNTLHEIADAIYISEPYLSKLLKQSEARFKVTLVNRNTKPISLTRAGEVVLEGLENVINAQNELDYSVLPFQTNKDYTLKIAFNHPLIETYGIKIIEKIISQFPQINFIFFEQSADVAKQSLINHEIDIFVGQEIMDQKILLHSFEFPKMYLIVPENSSLFNLKEMVLSRKIMKQISNIKLIKLTNNYSYHSVIDHYFQDQNIKISDVVYVSNLFTAIRLAVDGYGCTLATKDFAKKISEEENKKVKFFEIPDEYFHINAGVSILKDRSTVIKKISTLVAKEIKNQIIEFNN